MIIEKFGVLVRLGNGFQVQACVIFRLEFFVVLSCKPVSKSLFLEMGLQTSVNCFLKAHHGNQYSETIWLK